MWACCWRGRSACPKWCSASQRHSGWVGRSGSCTRGVDGCNEGGKGRGVWPLPGVVRGHNVCKGLRAEAGVRPLQVQAANSLAARCSCPCTRRAASLRYPAAGVPCSSPRPSSSATVPAVLRPGEAQLRPLWRSPCAARGPAVMECSWACLGGQSLGAKGARADAAAADIAVACRVVGDVLALQQRVPCKSHAMGRPRLCGTTPALVGRWHPA